MKRIFNLLMSQQDLLLVVAILAILSMLFVPIPPVMLDLFLVANFSIAMLVLLLTFYTDKPLSFSTFPSLLLITTLFRLGLNISATRLILSEGEAGKVISTVGSYVVGGNYVIGLVVFFILVIVQYVVVTNGAQRVAEVSARFTLDSMPGKQMSIDADLNMGLIDEKEAKQRRNNIEKEANFYGAMDGASKFVKGDAIAGIIIILIDIIGGLSVGIAQQGLSWESALYTYTLLTVGDGIVTQVPSIIIATATGIIITRAATDAHLGVELGKQITSSHKTLMIVGIVVGSAAFIPGIPKGAIVTISLLFLLGGYLVYRNQKAVKQDKTESQSQSPGTQAAEQDEDLGALLTIKPLELVVSPVLADALESDQVGFAARFNVYRSQVARELGLIIPPLQLTRELSMDSRRYQLVIFDVKAGEGEVRLDEHLIIDPRGEFGGLKGEATKEPTYGLPALWINPDLVELARKGGLTTVDGETLLLTHVSELVKRNCEAFVTRAATEESVNRLDASHSGLISELIPSVVTYSEVQSVLQALVKERVSIKNMEAILECLVDHGRKSRATHYLLEQVRLKLRGQIAQGLANESGELNVFTLDPVLEQSLIGSLKTSEEGVALGASAVTADLIIRQAISLTEQAMSERNTPILLCHGPLRLPLAQMLERAVPQLSVLSISEVPNNITVRSAAMIKASELKQAS